MALDLSVPLLLVVVLFMDFIAFGFFLFHSLCVFVRELSNDWYFKGLELYPLHFSYVPICIFLVCLSRFYLRMCFFCWPNYFTIQGLLGLFIGWLLDGVSWITCFYFGWPAYFIFLGVLGLLNTCL